MREKKEAAGSCNSPEDGVVYVREKSVRIDRQRGVIGSRCFEEWDKIGAASCVRSRS